MRIQLQNITTVKYYSHSHFCIMKIQIEKNTE